MLDNNSNAQLSTTQQPTNLLPTHFKDLQTCDLSLFADLLSTISRLPFEPLSFWYQPTGCYGSDISREAAVLSTANLREQVIAMLANAGFAIHNGSMYFVCQSQAVWIPTALQETIILNAFSAIRPVYPKEPKKKKSKYDCKLVHADIGEFCKDYERPTVKAVKNYIAATAQLNSAPPFSTVKTVVKYYDSIYSNTTLPALHCARAAFGETVHDSAYQRLKTTFEAIIENGKQIFQAFTYLCGLTASGHFLNERQWRRFLLIYGRCKGTGKTSMCITLGEILRSNKCDGAPFTLIPKGKDLGKHATSEYIDKLILDFDDNYEGKKILDIVSGIVNSSALAVEPKFCTPFTINNYSATLVQTVNEFPRNYDPSGLTTEKRFVWEVEPKEQYSYYDSEHSELRLIDTANQQLADCWRDIQRYPQRLAYEGLRAVGAITEHGEFVQNWNIPTLNQIETNLRLEHNHRILAPLGSTKHFEQWANNRTTNSFKFSVDNELFCIDATSTADLLIAYFYSVAYVERRPDALSGFDVGEALTIAYKAFGEGEPITLKQFSSPHLTRLSWAKQAKAKERNRPLKQPTNTANNDEYIPNDDDIPY